MKVKGGKGFGPASPYYVRWLLLRTFFRNPRNVMLTANVVLYVVGLSLVAVVVVPR